MKLVLIVPAGIVKARPGLVRRVQTVHGPQGNLFQATYWVDPHKGEAPPPQRKVGTVDSGTPSLFDRMGIEPPAANAAPDPNAIENRKDSYHYEDRAGERKRVRGKRQDEAPSLFDSIDALRDALGVPKKESGAPVQENKQRGIVDSGGENNGTDTQTRSGRTQRRQHGQSGVPQESPERGTAADLFGGRDADGADGESRHRLPEANGEPAEHGLEPAGGARDGLQPHPSSAAVTTPLPPSCHIEIGGTVEDIAQQADIPLPAAEATANMLQGRGLDREEIDNAASLNTDLRLGDEDRIGQGTLREKADDNFAAIALLKELEESGRTPSLEERRKLARFVGWGGFGQAFQKKFNQVGRYWETYEEIPSYYKQGWSEADKKHWEVHRLLQENLTEEEFAAARKSSLNAHYTSPQVVRAMWSAMERLGFKGGRVLEPSMGSGNFFGFMPDGMMARTRRTGIELDPVTGRIAQLLYPGSAVHIAGFEKTALPDNYFDLAISNVPFGAYRVADASFVHRNMNWLATKIHNYFFAKALDKVRPGGVIAFVTSHHTMDAQSSERFRNYLAEHADLVGAIRLHNKAFAANAGASVTTDIIILQKKDPAFEAEHPRDAEGRFINKFGGVVTQTAKDGQEYHINEYFAAHPEMISGEMGVGSGFGLHSKTDTGAKDDGRDMNEFLHQAIAALPQDIIHEAANEQELASREQYKDAAEGTRPGAFVIGDDGKLYVNSMGKLEPAKLARVPDAEARAIGQTRIRELAYALIVKQNEGATDIELREAQEALGKAYDEFVKKFGNLHESHNQKAFADDPDRGMMLALEDMDKKGKIHKAKIFTQRTIMPQTRVETAKDAGDALAIVLNETNNIDWKRMSELLQRPAEDIRDELAADGRIYQDPDKSLDPITHGWVPSDEYLSGEVRDKLKIAESMAASDSRYARNVEALKAVLPEDLTPDEIQARPGCHWIPVEYYHDFMVHLIGPDRRNRRRDWRAEQERDPDDPEKQEAPELMVKYDAISGRYAVPALPANDQRKKSVATTKQWGVDGKDALKLFEDMLNLQTPKIFYKDKDGNTHLDETATAAARAKAEEIYDEFRDWLWKDADRAVHMVRVYNDTFNGQVLRNYDGSHLTFPGLAADVHAQGIRQHIRNAVARAVQSGNTLFDHVVGAGKTRLMTMTAMELRRLGLSKKPMIVVPNHVLEQWERDIRELYPGAKVLTMTKDNWTKDKREEFSYRIATGDHDIVLVPMTVFERVSCSPKLYADFYQKAIDDIDAAIAECDDDKTAKRLETKRENMVALMDQKLLEMENRSDKTLMFDEMGVDSLFIDEAHYYKGLAFATKLGSMAGLGGTTSKRATDLFVKSQHLLGKNNQRGLYFATGTPISNSIAEMYTMQRYLMLPELIKKGLDKFDNWAATFGQVTNDVEMRPEGGYKNRERFKKFFNVPEMVKMYRTVADVKTRKDLAHILPTPPVANGGKPFEHIAPKSPALAAFMADLQERAAALKTGKVDPKDDNFLKITVDGRKASLDMRLVDPSAGNDPHGKVNMCVDNVARLYHESTDRPVIIDGEATTQKGCQLVFLDLGTPKGGAEAKKRKKKKGQAEEDADVDLDVMTASDPFEDGKDEPEPTDGNAAADVETAEEAELRGSVYEDIRRKLKAKGVKENEIAFIHDYNTPEEKTELFRAVNAGEIRVVLGSTGKMGSGANVQERLFAVHHLDCPWRPADLEQRDGRIIRQGNRHKEWDIPVQVHRYATKGSFDEFMWQAVESKAEGIEQTRRGDSSEREIEEADPMVMNAESMKAAASDNPWLLKFNRVKNRLRDLDMQMRGHAKARYASQQAIAVLPDAIKSSEAIRDKYQSAADEWERKKPKDEKFFLKVAGSGYDKREKAGDALLSEWHRANLIVGQTKPVAEIAGFTVRAALPSLDTPDPTFDVHAPSGQFIGRVSGDNTVGLTRKIENVLNALGTHARAMQDKIAHAESERTALQEQIDKRFPKEQELRDAQRQLKIYSLLVQGNSDEKQMTEEEAARKVDGLDNKPAEAQQELADDEADSAPELSKALEFYYNHAGSLPVFLTYSGGAQ